MKSQKPTVLMMSAGGEHAQKDLEILAQASSSYSNQANFVSGSLTEPTGSHFGEYIGLDHRQTALVWFKNERFWKFDLRTPLNLENIKDALTRYSNGDLQSYNTNQEDRDSLVHLTPNNYDQVVHNPSTFVVLAFVKEGCKSCSQVSSNSHSSTSSSPKTF